VEWDSFNRREFIIELSRKLPDWQTIVINRPASLIPNIFRPKKIHQFKSILNPQNIENTNIKIVRPFSFFHEHIGGRIFHGRGNWLLKKTIEWTLKKLHLTPSDNGELIIWIYEQPQWMIGKAFNKKNKKVIWEIFDDYRMTAQGQPRNMWVSCEPDMLKVADKIFTLTDRLKDKYLSTGIPITTMGNGYPSSLFYPRKKTPKELEGLKKIIMYLGIIRDWIDFDLVESLTRSASDCSFVFVGPVEKNVSHLIDKLKKYSNFTYIQAKTRNEVPIYMSAADVAIIPYLKNEFTASVKPIKLYEFLACGTPVVTTTSADINSIKGAIYCSEPDADLVCADIRLALFEADQATCTNAAESWSWSNVANRTINELGINEK